MKWRKLRWALRAALAVVLMLSAFVGWRWGSGNFGTVQPGRIFRSAQPSPGSLPGTIRAHGIRTVLNLRGTNPDQPWYPREREAALAAGATLVDLPLSSDQWLSREQARTLLDLLDGCEYPILIHCEWGAERTGLVSALCTLLREGSTLDDGRRAFSLFYLFVPMKDGLVMRGHLDAYAAWLAARNATHSPKTLRYWLLCEYHPGSPSREYWECNPYPLQVVSRPASPAEEHWSANPCPVRRGSGAGNPTRPPLLRHARRGDDAPR